MRAAVLAIAAVALWATVASAQQGKMVAVPFVGCASDGQGETLEAPTAKSENAVAPAAVAGQLAFYGSEHMGVLAPRGWTCLGLYGSNGVQLLVSPDSLADGNLTGVGIHLSRMSGGTSGRFAVARVAARYFPLADAFVQDVIDEGMEPKEAFPKSPFPKDKTTRRSETLVEFTTPANEDGMGTQSRLVKNGDPIQGAAILLPDEDMDLVMVRVRLPANQRGFATSIISGIETTQGDP